MRLDEIVDFNINDIVDEAFTAAMAPMTKGEREQFMSRYIKPMHLSVDAGGEVTVKLGNE